MPRLTVQRLRKAFDGKTVIHDVSFDAAPGDIVALIGPSGCGKTTVLRCILGELDCDGGRILVDGKDITHLRPWRRGVGIVYQRYALFPHMTVYENIAYGLRIRGDKEAAIRARVLELLDLVHLNGKEDNFPERLSGGERQRVALARALAVAPRILLLDEAFTALDATTRHRVIEEVRGIVRRLNVTTVLVTHDQEEAFLFANKVVVLNEGRVVVTGPPENVMSHTHPFIQDFVKMAVFHKGTVARDSEGRMFVPLANGNQVMVKKTGDSESIEVWPHGPGG
jgi:ABC-type Fe3+/spermidine/putrescine transport system ATPase subunit